MLKLYRLSGTEKRYWETWDNDDETHTIHWGLLGTRGETKTVKRTLPGKAESQIQSEIDALVRDGFHPIEVDDHRILLVEFQVNGFGTEDDLSKRHRLEDRMNETLGWTGLGHCDGGSIGSGTMEACCYVVDFELAKATVAADLLGTEFGDYTRIYDEDALQLLT